MPTSSWACLEAWRRAYDHANVGMAPRMAPASAPGPSESGPRLGPVRRLDGEFGGGRGGEVDNDPGLAEQPVLVAEDAPTLGAGQAEALIAAIDIDLAILEAVV